MPAHGIRSKINGHYLKPLSVGQVVMQKKLTDAMRAWQRGEEGWVALRPATPEAGVG